MVAKTIIEDDVVISGVSGRFPECDTVEEFQQKLFSGVDLVKENDSRWPCEYLSTYSGMGFMKDLRNFDAPFFGAHPKLAERTDPIVRTLLETSFEAVLDAGVCPTALRGSETGVVVVVSSNEAADWWSADPDRVNGYEFLGCTRTMYSNRISFSMDLKGPSYTMDSQSSSGLLGVQQAYHMLKCGMVDGVIVAGVNLVLNPHFNIMFKKLNMLSPDGKCKTFDADANGYARSEAAVAVFLQRAKEARRIYSYIAAVEANCDGYKEDGCTAISMCSQTRLYSDTYQRFNLNPTDVSFIEAHGYSTTDGDRDELNGIAKVFCGKGRRAPLLIGSVKSNVGHGEPVGGLVSLVKVIIAMENGILPPNLHFKTPNPHVPALKDGRLQVVDKLTVWNGRFAAINSFGIGGTNAHLVLKRNEKEKIFAADDDDDDDNNNNNDQSSRANKLPRIIAVSGRTENGVRNLLNKIENMHAHADEEFCALMNNIFSRHIQHYNYRAFSIFGSSNDNTQVGSDDGGISCSSGRTSSEVSTYIAQEGTNRSVCFVFSGMGSQWAGMCRDLLKADVFRRTMDDCDRVLKSVGFDLYAMLNSNDDVYSSNVLNSFVGITCTQIALVNILRLLNIEPDFMVGHSIGELGCAYADQTLSLEQTVLATYWRGKSLLQSNIEAGAMAAVGLSYDDARGILPADVTVACHNSVENVTISGPASSVERFVNRLQSEGIFARLVNSSGYAFHSQYIADAGSVFKTQLQKIITEPKLRSKRWISTSVPDTMWNTPSARYSSVEYHLNNLLSPVYFNKALSYVAENSVVVEIAPHALLQSILKSSLSAKCSHIGLMKRNQSTINDLLTNIGRLYNAGLQPQFGNLYRPVSWPVSRKTPMIQSMIEWDHSTKWFLVSFLTKPICNHGEIEVDVDVSDGRYKFLTDCVYDDTACFPVAAYLCLIWQAVAKFKYCHVYDVPLMVENFQILRRCVLSKQKPLRFFVNVLEDSGECEIREDGIVVARAILKTCSSRNDDHHDDDDDDDDDEYHATEANANTKKRCDGDGDRDNYLPLKAGDFYQDLFMKGYSYSGEFRRVLYVDNKGEKAKIAWSDNWIAYLEAMLQLHLLTIDKQQRHYAIDHIQRIIIDPRKHIKSIEKRAAAAAAAAANAHAITYADSSRGVAVQVFPTMSAIKAIGIEMVGIKSSLVSARKHQTDPIVLRSEFIPHFSNEMKFTRRDAIAICAQLVFENINDDGNVRGSEAANVVRVSRRENDGTKVASGVVRVAELITNVHAPCVSVDILETAQVEPYLAKPQVTIYVEKSGSMANGASGGGGGGGGGVYETFSNYENVTVVDEREEAETITSRKFHLVATSQCVSGGGGGGRKSTVAGETKLLNKLLQWLSEDGFILTYEEDADADADAVTLTKNCKLIGRFRTVDGGAYLLLRKTPKWKTPMVVLVRNDSYDWMDGVKIALQKHRIDKRNTMLMFYGNEANGVLGFVKSVRREAFGRGLRCLITDDTINPYKIVDLTYIEYLRKGLALNVYKNGEWGSYRYCRVWQPATLECEHAFIGVTRIGDLSSLAYIESRIPFIDVSNQANHELCSVYYSSIYAHDIRCALGQLPYDDYTNITKQGSVLGHEYSGRDSKGRRVCGMVGGGALATTVLADKTVMWQVPDHWSLEQASTIPRVYSVAYYALVLRANLRKEESVYIHAGVMGLCVACVNVATSMGARVFIGFRNAAEMKYLKETFSKLEENCFVNLEESSFDCQLLERTNHKGVDVIFDTLNSHQRNSFIDVLAFNGRLVEFEKSKVFDETTGYAVCEKNIVTHKISHNTLWVSDEGLSDRKRIRQLVQDGMNSGAVKPIITNVFTDNEIPEAFRMAQSGKFVGKIVIKIRDEEQAKTSAIVGAKKLVKAYPSAFLNPQNSYIVTGGLTDFGIQIVNWLINRGATKIVLSSQYRPVTGYQCLAMRRWQSCPVEVVLSNVDTTSAIGAQVLVEKANAVAPVGGIFHAACIECDRLFADCNRTHFDLLWKLKVDIAKNLDAASRKLCPYLKYFVGFSDISTLHGTCGKSALSYASSAMEAIYRARKLDNYPATLILTPSLDKFDVTKVQTSKLDVSCPTLSSSTLFSNMANLLNQPSETISIYTFNKNETSNHENSTMTTTIEQQRLIDDISDLLEIRDSKLVFSLNFQDIGIDPVVKYEIKRLLNAFHIDATHDEIGELSLSKIARILNKDNSIN